jgi:hypothetical protein
LLVREIDSSDDSISLEIIDDEKEEIKDIEKIELTKEEVKTEIDL